MVIEVKVPALSESVADATLVNWHKKVGEFVQRDENLVDLETDKVVLEVVAPHAGVLKAINKGDGELVLAGEVIATIDDEAKAEAGTAVAAGAANDSTVQHLAQQLAQQQAAAGAEQLLSPAARKLVADHHLDASRISGSGRDQRITKSDVLDYLQQGSEEAAPAAAEAVPPAMAEVTPLPLAGERPEQRVPMSRLRARVAQRLKEAQNTAAILTTFNEVNMQPVMELRKKYREQFEKQHGVRLGFMSFFAKAVTEALKQFPVVNASVEDEDIIYHGYYDIGIAVGSPRGLVVPILRDVDQMSFATIEKTIADFGRRAQEGKLSLEELTGGTFSITNGGTFGSMLSTPILNPPQSAILGMHKIQERPVVENGEIVIRPMMYVALSYDHRIIDGQDAVLFLVAIKNALEDPARLLLEI